MNQSKRLGRSTDTVMPLDFVRSRMRAPSRLASAADIEPWTEAKDGQSAACSAAAMAPVRDGSRRRCLIQRPVLVLRPFWYNPNRKHLAITERVLSAQVRLPQPEDGLEHQGRWRLWACITARMGGLRLGSRGQKAR